MKHTEFDVVELNRVVAFTVTKGDNNQPKIEYRGVVHRSTVLSPSEAVAALKINQFHEVLVRITDTSANEIRKLWNENYE